MIGINENHVNPVHPVRKVPPKAAKFNFCTLHSSFYDSKLRLIWVATALLICPSRAEKAKLR